MMPHKDFPKVLEYGNKIDHVPLLVKRPKKKRNIIAWKCYHRWWISKQSYMIFYDKEPNTDFLFEKNISKIKSGKKYIFST